MIVSLGTKESLLFMTLEGSEVRNRLGAGDTQAVAKNVTGHKTDSVFERYNIVDDRDMRQSGKNIEDYLAREEDNL